MKRERIDDEKQKGGTIIVRMLLFECAACHPPCSAKVDDAVGDACLSLFSSRQVETAPNSFQNAFGWVYVGVAVSYVSTTTYNVSI